MNIQETQERIVKEFSVLGDWTERYEYIIKLGRNIPEFPEEYRTEQNIVRGCQSRVWFHATLDDGKVKLYADSDAMIVKGLIALLLRVYSDRDPSEILENPPDFISDIGMDKYLSQTRANGFASMIKQIQYYALAYKTKLASEKAENAK